MMTIVKSYCCVMNDIQQSYTLTSILLQVGFFRRKRHPAAATQEAEGDFEVPAVVGGKPAVEDPNVEGEEAGERGEENENTEEKENLEEKEKEPDETSL